MKTEKVKKLARKTSGISFRKHQKMGVESIVKRRQKTLRKIQGKHQELGPENIRKWVLKAL
jgi:hypothetical protein